MMNETTEAACEEKRLLIQAEIDGELDASRVAVLVAHVAECAGCAAMRERMVALSATLRRDLAYHAAPATLRAAVEQRIAASRPAPPPGPRAASWARPNI